MSNNPQAFPVPSEIMQEPESDEYCFGMTLRDYFAAKAMQRLTGGLGRLQGKGMSAEEATQYMARSSYDIADAMLRARK